MPLCVLGQGFTISGDVKGSADGQTVTLKQFQNMQPVDVATAVVTGGKFTIRGNAPQPEFSQLFVGSAGPLQFFVENANMHILFDLEDLAQSKVTGSKENDLFMEFLTGLESFSARQMQLQNAFTALNAAGGITPELRAGLVAQAEAINNEQQAFQANFVMSNPGKVSSAFLTVNFLMQALNAPQLQHIANSFDAAAQQSQWVKMLKDHIASLTQTAEGQLFADITLRTPDDRPISISDIAGKGKYVLLDFWAAWCGPCRVANPHLVQIYNRYKDKGFEIVGISLDNNKEAWIKAIADDKLTWPQMSDLGHWNSAAARLYNIRGIPHMILLDRDGKIIAKGLNIATLSTKLAEIFD